MSFGSLRTWITVLCAVLLFAGCSGGGSSTTPIPGEAFSLIVTANPPVGDVGPAGLRVTFFVVASGGIAPYTYAWDFNGDNQTDLTTASGQWLFTTPGMFNVKVTVKDKGGSGDTVTATRAITVNDNTAGPPGDHLVVRFNASPQSGDLGFTCRFQSFVSGGKAPYSYEWDFDCDLSEWTDPVTGQIHPPTTLGAVPSTFKPDAFLKDPTWVYDKIGPHANDTPPNFTVFPVLRVKDGTGAYATNLDDILNNTNPSQYQPDGIPDFNVGLTVLPTGGGLVVAAIANPYAGQAPLTVEFYGAVTGGSGQYEFEWNFGEGDPSPFSVSSIASHTYLTPGSFSAAVTVRDTVSGQLATSAPVLITSTIQQQFSMTIKSDIGNHPGGYFDPSGTTTGFGIPTGVSGNITSGTALWNEKWNWSATPPVASPAGKSCSDCHAGGIQVGQSFQQFATVLRGTTHGPTGQESQAPNESDMTDAQIADLVAYSNASNGFEFAVGEVPFAVNFEALPVNGEEPILYQWDVFDETAADPTGLPAINTPPGLDSTAVVTPSFSFRKNPAIHFASTGVGAGPTFPRNPVKRFAVRCVATDAAGNTTVSNLIRVTANEHTSNGYYIAQRPFVEFRTLCPAETNPNASSNVHSLATASGAFWTRRANAAVCSHSTGISYILGGEILDETGAFVRLVDRGDSAYMYIPETLATATFQGAIGKFNTVPSNSDAATGRGGSMVHLADNTKPAFPSTPKTPFDPPYPGSDTTVPPQQVPTDPPATPPPTPTLRSAPFTIVGSAAAVLMHEQPETNPTGAFPHQPPVPDPDPDEDLIGFPNLYAYPDASQGGWNLDAPPFDMSGIGSPIIYVIGGRTDATTPTDLVQKYYPFGFGSEDLIPWSQTFSFQTTGNQVDIWSPYFLRPDTDQFKGSGTNFDPDIDDRREGSGNEPINLPRLPVPLYGLMAVKVETGVDTGSPSFPNGPYRSIFIFGGIDNNGAVIDQMRWWNVNLTNKPTDDPGGPGIFSLFPDANTRMPVARAYGKAVFIPTNPFRVALVGGIDNQGVPLNTIDIFTFGSNYNPASGGGWSTFTGTLPEALEACGAGYSSQGEPVESWVLAFGGWTGKQFNYHTYNARTRSAGNLVISQSPVVVPRSNAASAQCYSGGPLGLSQEVYYLFGGTDENGVDSVVEVFNLP